VGAVGVWLLLGRRVWVRGSWRKRLMMWALARADSSGGKVLAGCMCLRYARQRPSIELKESWLAGKEFLSYSPGKGRKEGSLMVWMVGGMVVVRVQEAV